MRSINVFLHEFISVVKKGFLDFLCLEEWHNPHILTLALFQKVKRVILIAIEENKSKKMNFKKKKGKKRVVYSSRPRH